MPHQQKLVHIQEIPGAAADGNVYITTLFHIDDICLADSYHLARHETTVEVIGGDPNTDFRWWTTFVTTVGFWFNWSNLNQRLGGPTIRIVSHVFHSMCFDISTAQPPY